MEDVMRLSRMQFFVDGRKEMAIIVYWVFSGIDCCLIGFLPRHYHQELEQIFWSVLPNDKSPLLITPMLQLGGIFTKIYSTGKLLLFLSHQ